MLTGCKDTLFFAFMQAGVPQKSSKSRKNTHIAHRNTQFGHWERWKYAHFLPIFFVQNGESFAEVEVVEIIPERV